MPWKVPALVAVVVAVLVVPAQASAASYGSRTMRAGMSGSDVRTLQRYLDRVGFDTSTDGAFGSGTKLSVQGFERKQGLTPNGVVTRSDARALKRLVASGASTLSGDPSGGFGMSDDPADDDPVPGDPTTPVAPGSKATLSSTGLAIAPADAPQEIKDVIAAGNKIAKKPYVWGGGHGRWIASGYDCSGSVSYALHGGGLLSTSLDSTGFMSWGQPGRGTWITIRSSPSHAYMIVAGLRFDTSASKVSGSRWTTEMRSARGYRGTHPVGF